MDIKSLTPQEIKTNTSLQMKDAEVEFKTI